MRTIIVKPIGKRPCACPFPVFPDHEPCPMPRFAANLSLMYAELPFLERLPPPRATVSRPWSASFYAFEASVLAAQLAAHGLQLVLFNAPAGGMQRSAMVEAGHRACAARRRCRGARPNSAPVLQALEYAEVLQLPAHPRDVGHCATGLRRSRARGAAAAARFQPALGRSAGRTVRARAADRAHQPARHARLRAGTARRRRTRCSTPRRRPTSRCRWTCTTARSSRAT